MTEAIAWLLASWFVGLAVFPFTYAAFPSLADRGWALSRPIGLLVLAAAVWLLGNTGAVPSTAVVWWSALAALTFLVWAVCWQHRHEIGSHLRDNWKAVAATEAVYLSFFAAWTLYRVYDPAIAGTEKPMDLMNLNAAFRADGAPPEDAWLSGHPVAYYYFGYWMFAGMAKVAAVPPAVAYNLALSLVAAMAASSAFSLVFSLVVNSGGRRIAAAAAGIAGVFMLLVISSLAGWWELLANFGAGGQGFYDWLGIRDLEPDTGSASWRPESHWWWWRASRVINTFDASGNGLDFTIQEFPFFSLLLGDLHPHLMSLPFVIGGLSAAYCVLDSKERWGLSWLVDRWPLAATVALLAGAAGFINAWDIAFLAAALAGAVALRVHRETSGGIVRSFVRGLPALLVLLFLGVGLFAPFYFGTFQSQVRWPPVGPAEFGTRPVHFITVWGFLLLAVTPVLAGLSAVAAKAHWAVFRAIWSAPQAVGESRAPGPSAPAGPVQPPGQEPSPAPAARAVPGPRLSLAPLWLALATVIVPYVAWGIAHYEFNDLARPADALTRLAATLPLMAAIVILFVAVVYRARRGENSPGQFVLLTCLLSLLLLYGAELFFVHDLFGSRMNTVFKFYYEAWVILAVAGAYGLWWWWRAHSALKGISLGLSRTGAIVACVLLVGPLYYPLAASFSKANNFSASPTLDGLAYIRSSSPSEHDAIEFLTRTAAAGETLVEAPGGSYTEFARISGSTGIPTVMGWTGHEHQWRGSLEPYSDREPDIERLYSTPDPQVAATVARKYGIDFVVVGPRERRKYGQFDESKFASIGRTVFERPDFTIYRLDLPSVD
jgi:uncharacterized membrane protein